MIKSCKYAAVERWFIKFYLLMITFRNIYSSNAMNIAEYDCIIRNIFAYRYELNSKNQIQ